jgi:hypothetical protein
MTLKRWITAGSILVALCLLVSFPVWGMGVAVFMDITRSVISARPSPDGRRIAQVETINVGGVPSTVVTVRSSWKPNWYLASCAAAYHYHDGGTVTRVEWTSAKSLKVSSTANSGEWQIGVAPFLNGTCPGLVISVVKEWPLAATASL